MENDNVIQTGNSTLIINGGNALNDCPTDWGKAEEWAEKANEDIKYGEPTWSWDCGFKLDYDGGLINVSSRFYPPKTHQGSTWDGDVSISIGDKEIKRTSFDCKTLEDLKIEVEKHIKEIKGKIEAMIDGI